MRRGSRRDLYRTRGHRRDTHECLSYQIFRGVGFEFFFTAGAAKVISLARVFMRRFGASRVHRHSAYRIFFGKNCLGIHSPLPELHFHQVQQFLVHRLGAARRFVPDRVRGAVSQVIFHQRAPHGTERFLHG